MSSRSRERIAAIDIGTNSIHMIVAERWRGGYRIIDREKEMAQLGLSSLDGQPLTGEAMERGVETITRMCEIASRWNAKEIVAVATSAVREAPNRKEFLRRVRETAGIRVDVISGEEEADLIFRAVRTEVQLDGSTALCIDIGGGSVELIVGTSDEIFFASSEPLGSLRMAQRFSLQDRPAPESIAACRREVQRHMRKLRKRIVPLGIDLCVGTSGTIQALTALFSETGSEPVSSGLREMSRATLEQEFDKLAARSNRERVDDLGVEPKRSSTIVAGAIVLEEILKTLSIRSIVACPVAIREGIISSRMSESQPSRSAGSLRLDLALALAERTDCDLRHARQVAKLAARIFEQTRELHGLPAGAGELLEYAALMHEAGRHVSERAHHQHTYYLIRHAELKGFSDEQLLVVANVGRYYRKKAPQNADGNLLELTEAQRLQTTKLAAILRIAEGLDRGHRQRVRDVGVRMERDAVSFSIRSRSDARVEVASAIKRAKYFASLFEVSVRFETN
jgi:exopolyphosphatase/guanosine-5'-triphosphate,3'-diphosphate pyrophosphatase